MISIIVPVYNVLPYLKECLDSIARQNFDDYEVVIIDDGSNDGSEKFVDEYSKDKRNFSVFHKSNGGLMSAWMEGVMRAKGDYIGFVDSDDYVASNMFSSMYEIAKSKKVDIVICDRYEAYETETKYQKVKKMRPGLYQNQDMEWIYKNILPGFNGWHISNARWNKIYKTEILRQNLKYCRHKSRYCEDRFIVPACMFSAKSIYYLNQPLYYYRLRTGSATNVGKIKPELYDAIQLLIEMQQEMLMDKHIYEKYLDNFNQATLNYMRIIIVRNLLCKGSLSEKKKVAGEILKNDIFSANVALYASGMTGKMGSFVKVAFKFKSDWLFATICQISYFFDKTRRA